MQIEETSIPDVVVVVPSRHRDDRGFLSEIYNDRTLEAAGITDAFVQENHIYSRLAGTVRGIHFQLPPAETSKLVRVLRGAIYDVVVDLRPNSPSFGHHVAIRLSSSNWKQIYVPRGFGHGLCTLEDDTEVAYRSSEHWSPEVDRGVRWNDPDLGIDWPISDRVVVSDKDRSQPLLGDAQLTAADEGH